jgi:hypothetical protein
MLVLSARSGQLSARIGPRLQMGVGPVVVGVGLALLTRSTGSSSYVSTVLPAVLVLALGLAVTVAPLTTTALGAAPSEHAGIASAVNNYVARVGSLLAVAVLPAVAGISGRGYGNAALLSGGFRKAMLITASMCVLGGSIAAIGIRNPPRPKRRRTGPIAGAQGALDAPPLSKD